MRAQTKFSLVLVAASLVGILLFAIGAVRNHSFDYWYLPFNLALGVIPLVLALGVRQLVGRKGWRDWRVILLAVLWLLFLPNSFYIVTDFIHLPEVARVDMVQDIVMLMQFSVAGLVAGFTSLYMMHAMLLRKFGHKVAMSAAIGVLYLCSFAVYLGREMRWNSWDLVLNPVPLLTDVLYLWVSPGAFVVILSYFGMLVTFYLLWWYAVKASTR